MSQLNKKALDGNVETLILALLEQGPNYGYQIVQDLNQQAPALLRMGEGTVYPVLHRLEERGLIRANWKKGSTGRQRKYYSLTQRGLRGLEMNHEQWRSLVRVMERVLEPRSRAARPNPSLKPEGGIA